MLSELVFILDRSGSMSGLEKDTIGGFNSLIEKQKKEAGDAFINLVLFDHEVKVVLDRIRIQDVNPLNEEQYYVRGCTALYDAIGKSIKHIKRVHKYVERKPDKTLFVITTDGYENASREFSVGKVKKLVEQQKECGWEFLFLGANLDAVEVGKSFGLDELNSVTFECDSEGTELNYSVVSEAIVRVRKGNTLSKDWKESIENDYRRRHK